MEEVKKKDILLNLADLDDTARVCRALSSETRLEANLISVVPKPGIRGSQKLCGMKTTSVTLDLFAHVNKRTGKQPAYIYMPIGHYSNCVVCPPCGIASATSYLHYEDSPYGFYFSDHIDAAIIWFTKGFLEYSFQTSPFSRERSHRSNLPLKSVPRHLATTITGPPILRWRSTIIPSLPFSQKETMAGAREAATQTGGAIPIHSSENSSVSPLPIKAPSWTVKRSQKKPLSP